MSASLLLLHGSIMCTSAGLLVLHGCIICMSASLLILHGSIICMSASLLTLHGSIMCTSASLLVPHGSIICQCWRTSTTWIYHIYSLSCALTAAHSFTTAPALSQRHRKAPSLIITLSPSLKPVTYHVHSQPPTASSQPQHSANTW